MKILILNSGSSSLKYQFMEMPSKDVLCQGIVENIGLDITSFGHNIGDKKIKFKEKINNHKEALNKVLFMLFDGKFAVISNLDEIDAVGHRVVHGGEEFTKSVIVDDEVIKGITNCEQLAPLHNPANKLGIIAIKEILADVPQVVVFDTAFHQTIKQENYLYAIDYNYYTNHKIRRYGFHGTSHKYISNRISEILDKKVEKIINCHVGNGASIAAIQSGKVVDTSMGFTPLEGLIMGTRSGDLDPSIIPFLMKKEGLSIEDIENILNKKSGVLGITQKTSDMKEVCDLYIDGDKRAILAINMYVNRIIKYIGSYTALMGGVDVVCFTGGVLENSSLIRKLIVDKLVFIGVKLEESKNDFRGEERIISTESSDTKIMVIPTNEELVIASDTYNLLK